MTVDFTICRMLKMSVNGKRHYISDDFPQPSVDLIASPPSRDASFDMPIRPASSSPTEDIECNKRRAPKTAPPKPLRIEKTQLPKDGENDVQLEELKEEVNKFAEVLEADMVNLNASDVSLNLSDVTYKWSV